MTTKISRKNSYYRRSLLAGIGMVSTIAILCSTAQAASQAVTYDIPSQSLAVALKTFAQQSNLQVMFSPEVVKSRIAPRLAGQYEPDQALQALLVGTDLEYRHVSPDMVTISAKTSADVSGGAEAPSTQAAPAEESPVGKKSQSGESNGGEFRQVSHTETTGEANRENTLEEVIVMGAKRKFAPEDSSAATKINMSVLETPQALTVLSSELMSIVGVQTSAQAAALAPGVVNKEGEIQVWDDTVARGFGVNPFNSNKINGMAYQRVYAPDFGIVERLEVVRGPAAIIYGQSDYGATVNIQLKAPKAKRQFAGELGYSIDGGYRALLDVTGALTKDERLRARMIVIYDDSRSPQDYAFSRSATVAPSISWDLTENTTLDVNYFHGQRDFRRAYGFGLAQDEDGNLSLPDVSKKAFIGADFGNSKSSVDFVIAKLTQKLSDSWVLTAAGSWHHTYLNWYEPYAAGAIPPSGLVPLYDFEQVSDTYDKTGDLTLVGDFNALGHSHTLMLNALVRENTEPFFVVDNIGSLGDINVFDPAPWSFDIAHTMPSHPKDSPQTSDVNWHSYETKKDMALSGMLLLHPVDRLSVMLGLRWNQFKRTHVDFYDHSISFQTPDHYKNHAFNHRVGLVYELLDNFNIYGSYSDGTLFNPTLTVSGDSLPPETGVQWEFGAKTALLDKKLNVALSVFKIDRNNVAVHDPDTPMNSPYSIAINGQTHKGFELEAVGEPIPGWNIISSYSYLDVKVTNAPNPGMIGKQRANSPHHMVKLYTTYQLLNGPLKGVSLGGGMFYTSKREVDNFGSFQLPAYTRVDLRLGYDGLENVSFSVNAINVADKKILTSFAGWTGGGIDYQSRRTVFFRMNFKY